MPNGRFRQTAACMVHMAGELPLHLSCCSIDARTLDIWSMEADVTAVVEAPLGRGPDHRCDCRPGLPALSLGKIEQPSPVAVRSIKVANETITPSPLCKPGEYMCSPFRYGLIVVCDYTGTWQVSADCGKTSDDSNW